MSVGRSFDDEFVGGGGQSVDGRVVDMYGHGRASFVTVTKFKRTPLWDNGFDEGPFVACRRALLTVSLADDEVLELSELLVN